MSKKKLLLIAISFSGLIIVLINLFYKKQTILVQNKQNIQRNIIDSFVPTSNSLVFKLTSEMLRTSITKDTARILTQDFKVLNLYNSQKLSYTNFRHKGEFWYFNISKGDTMVFDKNANKLIGNKTSFNFDAPVNVIEKINDSIFFIEQRGKKVSFLNQYNIKSNKTLLEINLFSALNIKDDNSEKVPNLVTFGAFAQNTENVYYLLYRAGYIIRIIKASNEFQVYRTIDSSATPNFIKKNFTMNGEGKSYLTYEEENWINMGIGCTTNYVVILSGVTNEKDCVFLDYYAANDLKYIKSIKILNTHSTSKNSSAYEIICTSKDIYLIYDNDEVYVKKNCL